LITGVSGIGIIAEVFALFVVAAMPADFLLAAALFAGRALSLA
jgi:hypothetical protein